MSEKFCVRCGLTEDWVRRHGDKCVKVVRDKTSIGTFRTTHKYDRHITKAEAVDVLLDIVSEHEGESYWTLQKVLESFKKELKKL